MVSAYRSGFTPLADKAQLSIIVTCINSDDGVMPGIDATETKRTPHEAGFLKT